MSARILAQAALLLLLAGCTTQHLPTPTPSQEPPPIITPPGPVETPPTPVEKPPTPPPVEPTPEPTPEPLPAGVSYELGSNLILRVAPAVGAMPSVQRAVHLIQTDGTHSAIINTVNLPYMPGGEVAFTRRDLPGYPGAVVIETKRPNGVRHGAVAVVDGKLVALDFHRLVAPDPEIKTGTFLYLNKWVNELWVFKDGALVAYFPTANGRDPWGTQPTWEDYKNNFKTPEGLFPIKSMVINPPYNSLTGHPSVPGGAPGNPLGTRWMGFEALPGDSGGVWAFHGTAAPEQIGTWASEGCVRLNTADAEKLYSIVSIGTMVRVVSGV